MVDDIECLACGALVETYPVPTERMSGWCFPCQRHVRIDAQNDRMRGYRDDRLSEASDTRNSHIRDRTRTRALQSRRKVAKMLGGVRNGHSHE